MSDLVWRETLRTALLGTERAGADTRQVKNSAVATLMGETAFDSAESRLLTQAGLLAIHRLIGTNPVSAETPPPLIARQETAANPALSNLLGSMLDGRYKDVLPELLAQLHQAKLVAPAERVPNLLAYAESSLVARHLVCQILSGHAREIAALNPAWSFAAADTLDWDGARREWKASKPAKRQAFLRQLRHLAPDFGRELLRSTWKAEAQHVRLWFVRILKINLTMADEPFLETALDDRALSVRKEAVELLSMLPQSRLGRRMAQRTRAVLTWHKTEERLVVRFPVGVNRLMQRDGVPVELKSKSEARLRSSQLQAMVSTIPLDVWTERFGVPPAKILSNLTASKWPQTLLKAFTDAALRQGNAVWAKAILSVDTRPSSAKLFNLLSDAERSAMFVELAAKQRGVLDAKGALLTLAYQSNGAWTQSMVDAFLAAAVDHFNSAEPDHKNAMLGNALRKLVKGCPPSDCERIATILLQFTHFKAWRSRLHDLVGLARTRKKMYDALALHAGEQV